MFYYKYDQNAIITHKSNEPFADHCAHSDLDFDLDLYVFTITRFREDGWILKWDAKESPFKDLALTIRSIRTDNSELKERTALLEDCVIQLADKMYQ